MRQQTLRFGDAWARIGPWRGGDRVAHLVVAPDSPLSGEAVLACLKKARAAGYEEVLTSAMGPAEEEPFVEARFTVRERLHLLTREIDDEPQPTEPARRSGTEPVRRSGTEPARPVSRATRRDRAAVLALDDVAFDTFWRLGALGLRDALEATPVHQFRAARSTDGQLTGYAITGRAGNQGYLQRVAVHPDAQRQGWGAALVADAMHWLWRHGAVRAFVNTHLENDAALSLYSSFGFSVLPAGLAVLGRSL